MGVEQAVGYFRAFLQSAANGGRDGLAGFAAQPRPLADMDADTAHAAHFVETRGDDDAHTQLFMDALLHLLQIRQALKVFQPFEQAFFLGAGEQQDTQVAAGVIQQLLAPAIAGTGGAGLA